MRRRLSLAISLLIATAILGALPAAAGAGGRLVAGGAHSCLLDDAGPISCWGANGALQMALDGGSPRIEPVAIGAFAASADLKSMTAGSTTACAITNSAAAFCWGTGFLGSGSFGSSAAPLQLALDGEPTALGGGHAHGCVAVAQATVRCWGNNSYGQIGTRRGKPVATPQLVEGVGTGTVSSLSSGYGSHTCAVVSGAVSCWGRNDRGQLGSRHAGPDQFFSAAPLAVPAIQNAVEVDAGDRHSCARQADGAIRCWGDFSSRQRGTRSGLIVPGQIGGPATQLALGAHHACALSVGGTVTCWGANGSGQLGIASDRPSAAPTPVTALGQPATAIAAGAHHTCALLSDDSVRCWGANNAAQLGNRSFAASNRPMLVAFAVVAPLTQAQTPTPLLRFAKSAEARRRGRPAAIHGWFKFQMPDWLVAGHACSGTVSVEALGAGVSAQDTVAIRPAADGLCAARVRFSTARADRRGTVNLNARFAGNAWLAPASASADISF